MPDADARQNGVPAQDGTQRLQAEMNEAARQSPSDLSAYITAAAPLAHGPIGGESNGKATLTGGCDNNDAAARRIQ